MKSNVKTALRAARSQIPTHGQLNNMAHIAIEEALVSLENTSDENHTDVVYVSTLETATDLVSTKAAHSLEWFTHHLPQTSYKSLVCDIIQTYTKSLLDSGIDIKYTKVVEDSK